MCNFLQNLRYTLYPFFKYVPLLLYLFPVIQSSFLSMSIETASLNIDSWVGSAPITIRLLLSSSFNPFHHICCSYFLLVILWKLYIVHDILLEAFKRISCSFTFHTIKVHNQNIPFLMIYKMLISISQSLNFAFFWHRLEHLSY